MSIETIDQQIAKQQERLKTTESAKTSGYCSTKGKSDETAADGRYTS